MRPTFRRNHISNEACLINKDVHAYSRVKIIGPRLQMNGTTARVILVTGLLFATSWPSQVALAKTIKPFRVGGWAGGVVVDDQTKKFVHCSASLSNSRNTSISYTLNERYSWQLSLSNSAWNFSPGFGLVVGIRVNDRLIPNQPAVFTSNQTLQLQLADSVSAFEMLQVTRKIQVETRGIQLDFELMENNDVLAALVDCVNQQTGRGKYAKLNARAKRTRPAKPAVMRDAALVAEATAIADQLSSRTQIRGWQVLPAKDLPPGWHGDAVWKAGAAVGTLNILQSAGGPKLEDLAIDIVEKDVVSCPGQLFAAASRDRLDQTDTVKVFTSCRSADFTTIKYYLGIARERGGFYLFDIRQNGNDYAFLKERPAKEMDTKISAVIAHVLANVKPATLSDSQ